MRGQTVAYSGDAPAGTIVVETGERALYLVTGKGQAIKYPVGVGRSGQQWFGATRIVSKHIKPAWKPPESIRGRRSPDFYIESGSPKNPMGAAALVLRDNELAIHGTNNPGSIGGFVSAGCIRMHNKDIMDLFGRVTVGTRVVFPRVATSASKPPAVSAEAKPAAARGPAASTDGAKAAETPAKPTAEWRRRTSAAPSRQPIGGAGGRHGALARNWVVEAARLTQRREALLDLYHVILGALLFVSPWLLSMSFASARRCVRRRRAARAGDRFSPSPPSANGRSGSTSPSAAGFWPHPSCCTSLHKSGMLVSSGGGSSETLTKIRCGIREPHHTLSTKLSTTRFSPALSNAMVSLLPSTTVTLPLPNFW